MPSSATNTSVLQDIPPYVLATGHPAEPRSVNIEGIKRRGFTDTEQRAIRNAYRVLYRSELKLEEALAQLRENGRRRAGAGADGGFHRATSSTRGARARTLTPRVAASPHAPQLTIGLVAGEVSGDLLGGALIQALREWHPGAHFVGLTGEHMLAAGCESLGICEELAVMGLVPEAAWRPPPTRGRRQRIGEAGSAAAAGRGPTVHLGDSAMSNKQVQDAYIVAASRTPIGKSGRGYFRNTRPDDLLVAAIQGALRQVPGLDPKAIEDAIVGCAMPEGEQGANIARIGALLAGLPQSVAASPSTASAPRA